MESLPVVCGSQLFREISCSCCILTLLFLLCPFLHIVTCEPSPTITLCCAAEPSLHLRKGSFFIMASTIQSVRQPRPGFQCMCPTTYSTLEEIEQRVSTACHLATFRCGSEDLFDETCRKTVKT